MNNYPHLKVDLSNCDKEPIHIIGRLQAHGFLLILDSEGKTVRQVSQNLEDLTGIAAKQCLNRALAQLFPQEALYAIGAAIAEGAPLAPFPVLVLQPQLRRGRISLPVIAYLGPSLVFSSPGRPVQHVLE